MLKNENQDQAASIDQEIEAVYQNLEKTVDSKIRLFIANKQQEIEKAFKTATATNAATNAATPLSQPKTLPWFAGGIKGFLRKLWHGNSSSNPDWQWNTVKESCTLNEYAYIKSEIENILFETDMLDSDDIKALVTDIMMSVRKAVEDTKMIINKSERGYARGQRRSRRINRDATGSDWQQVQQPVEEPNVQSSPTVNEPETAKTEPESNKIETKPEPAAEPEVATNSGIDSPAPEESRKKRKLGELGRGKFKSSKETKEKPPELSFDEMKLKAEDAKSIAENMNFILSDKLSSYYGGNLTKKEKQEKAEIIKEMSEMLKGKGIEITNQHFIASTESNAIKLVQIMKELEKIEQYYNWKEIENYHVVFPEVLYNNTDGLIKKAIEMFESEPQAESKPDYNESLNHYLNNKNKLKIEEKKALFVNLLKENSQENLNILKSKKTKDRKLNLIKR
jgi:hypothetical protein